MIATTLVERAIADWEAVVNDFNYDGDNNPNTTNALNDTFQLTVNAGALNPTTRGTTNFAAVDPNGLPTMTTITMDNDGGGDGWFFDTTPLDDAEFTGIASAFQASFIDATVVGQAHQNDFYRTIVHEIGHALGITSNPNAAIDGMLTNTGITDPTGLSTRVLETFVSTRVNPQFGVQATFIGGHLYEGSANDPGGLLAHANELMNPGRTVPGSPVAPFDTVRQFVSDLDVMILADAYGYAVTLPGTLDTAHATLDSLTGTLLVQGLPGAVNETITVTPVGNDIQVVVDGTTELILQTDVRQIVIAGNGGNDVITVDAQLNAITQMVDYVVSSNEDAVDNGAVGDGLVDLDAAVPGNQVALRAAVQDANANAGADAIYVGRGNYNLNLTAVTETIDDAVNDLDITSDMTIVGAGSGLTVIDSSGLGSDSSMGEDRSFDVIIGGRLDISGVTITGGNAGNGGALLVRSGAILSVDRSALVGNTASTGGALHVQADTTGNAITTISNSVITNNTAQNGGGLRNDIANMIIVNSIFANNTATADSTRNDLFKTGAGSFSSSSITNLFTSVGNASELNNANNSIGSVDYVVASLADAVDANLSDALAQDASGFTTLRAAVQEANDEQGAQTIWLPAWRLRISRAAVIENIDDSVNDLDITSNVTLLGVGPGLTVIDSSGLGSDSSMGEDRSFDVENGGTLGISGVTITGGNAGNGGAIVVRSGGSLDLSRSALIDNVVASFGGAIHVMSGATSVSITDSVIANNSAGGNGSGGGIRNDLAGLVIGNTILANDIGIVNREDVFVAGSGSFTSLGGNMLTTTGNTTGFASDFVGPADFVVTSIADTFQNADDNYSLSLREAVDLANNAAGEDEVWLPAWDFVLTRERDYSTQLSDTDVSYGDIDISDSIVLRGIEGETSVDWFEGVTIPDNNRDKIFDLLGSTADGTSDATANGADFVIWQREFGGGVGDPIYEEFLADFDDDGDVDGDDQGSVWQSYFGNTLDLEGIDVLS